MCDQSLRSTATGHCMHAPHGKDGQGEIHGWQGALLEKPSGDHPQIEKPSKYLHLHPNHLPGLHAIAGMGYTYRLNNGAIQWGFLSRKCFDRPPCEFAANNGAIQWKFHYRNGVSRPPCQFVANKGAMWRFHCRKGFPGASGQFAASNGHGAIQWRFHSRRGILRPLRQYSCCSIS